MQTTAVDQSERPAWLNEVAKSLPYIKDFVENEVPEDYRTVTFGVLVRHALGEKGPPTLGVAPSRPPVVVAGEVPLRFAEFLRAYEIPADRLHYLVDLAAGDVLTRNIGHVKRDGTRRLAALIALFNASKTGEFVVPRTDHVKQCLAFGVYDSANYASTMKTTEFANTAVFRLAEKDWQVTRPGEAYVAAVVKELLGGVEQ